jgi:hypothetical protein
VGRQAILLRYVTYPWILFKVPELSEFFSPLVAPPELIVLLWATATAATIFAVVAFLATVRRAWVLKELRQAFITSYALFAVFAVVLWHFTALFETHEIPIGGMDADAVTVFKLRYRLLWPAGFGVLVMGLLHLLTWTRRFINHFTGETDTSPAIGDRILENLRTHGRDPDYRRSSLTSNWLHLLIIVIIPWLLTFYGCIDPYKPPYGGGNPVVRLVQVVKPKKKERKKFILRPDAAVYFRRPDLDDSEVMEEVEEITQVRYTADASAAHGNLGDGTAATPGWADGFRDGIVRYIRLEYNGRGWDDGMDLESRADMNFLEKFRDLSGGMKTADNSESHPIRLLKKYPRTQAPPFVYMTGDGDIRVSGRDIKILRKFLEDGSLLFADCGSASWDRSFRSFAAALFPGNPLRVIADDDPIFQLPFGFPNGAPPLWHHGGRQAMGIKHKGRWVVFYHPGDVNDAWKTGHSGLDSRLAQSAYHLGINIVYYSFMRYFEETRELRK